MPLTTRGYDYPAAADPADGPADLQALATSIDTDISASLPPLVVSTLGDLHTLPLVGAGVSTVGAANRGLTVCVRMRETLTPTKFVWWCTTQNGNYDIGIINWATRARLWSKGVGACPAAGEIIVAIAAGPTLVAGVEYGLCISADNNTMAVHAATLAAASLGTMYDNTIGIGYAGAQYPIPNPFGALTAGTVLPALALRA